MKQSQSIIPDGTLLMKFYTYIPVIMKVIETLKTLYYEGC